MYNKMSEKDHMNVIVYQPRQKKAYNNISKKVLKKDIIK